MATITATANPADASVSLTAGSLSGVATISITRNNPDGSVSPVRGATSYATNGATTLAFFDFEAPLDQLVTYTLTLDVGSPVTSSGVTIVTDGGTYWLKNISQQTLSATVEVIDLGKVTRPARVLARYDVLGRANPVVVSDVRGGRVGAMVIASYELAEAADIRALFAHGFTLFLQAPASTNFPDMYFVAGDVEELWAGMSDSTVRLWTVPYTEVDSPTDALVSLGANSWAQVALFGSWQNLKDKRTTWLDVLNRPFTQADA